MSFSIDELWELQEKLFEDPRFPEMLEVVKTFPKPKSGTVYSPEEHLINIIFGFYMEQEAITALKERGYDAEIFLETKRYSLRW